MVATDGEGYRPLKYGDPAVNLEVNTFVQHDEISSYLIRVDMARTPTIIKGWDEQGRMVHVDIHGKGYNANKLISMVTYRDHKLRGRT